MYPAGTRHRHGFKVVGLLWIKGKKKTARKSYWTHWELNPAPLAGRTEPYEENAKRA